MRELRTTRCPPSRGIAKKAQKYLLKIAEEPSASSSCNLVEVLRSINMPGTSSLHIGIAAGCLLLYEYEVFTRVRVVHPFTLAHSSVHS